jgi:hypothetical protein
MAAPANPGANEGIRVLDDFTCDAIPAAGLPRIATPGKGVNSAMRVLAEFAVSNGRTPLTTERTAELRALSNDELLTLVRSNASELSAEDLRVIHDIAIERLTREDGPRATEAAIVAREAMVATLNRIAP